eukprot:CAMPEP_0116013528 /NCGR_PEP_ID=MMETSP0321-20121206/5778_1 /TAXON_ID=163516 /ORGANISM="Leptocylindrus danicus var. danicus, Strain B650" /LENGTH=181 /DNA_ID=CAMNT_0003483091 /DNA_START=1 /DNA_END=547 /DNA_ORIENTATION=+
MYRTMDIMECIAYSDEEYVQLAIRIGSNRHEEQNIRRRIGSKKHLLYESSLVIEEWNEDLQLISLSDNMLTGRGLHDPSLLFAAKFRDKEMTLLARITHYGVENALGVAQELANLFDPEPIKRRFFTNILLHGERRYNEEVVSTHPVRYQNNTYGPYDIVVRYGDDLASVATYYGTVCNTA